jgi:Fic family protein
VIPLQWEPIRDLPENWRELASPELASLAGIWQEQRARIQNLDAVVRFNERLRREWAIETGIIENLYSIDRGTTQLLIEHGLEASLIPYNATDKSAELVIDLIHDQEDVLEGIMDFVGQSRELSTSYVKELHAALTRNQPAVMARDSFGRSVETELVRGDWKRLPNNPTRRDGAMHQYAPPEHVAAEMDRLIAMHREHMEVGVAPEVAAAWLHHRFTQIHPFQDGNGRMARALASLVLLRAGYFPFVVNRDVRSEYITACELADVGDLSALVRLITRSLKSSFVKVLSIVEDVIHDVEPVNQMVSAIGDRLRTRATLHGQEMRSVLGTADRLASDACGALQQVEEKLRTQLHAVDPSFRSFVDTSSAANDFYFKSQVIAIAGDLGYYADFGVYRRWVRLKIKELREVDLVISFHSLGFDFVGIVAASAYVEYRERTEDEGVTVDGPHRICAEVYQCSYREDPDEAAKRFAAWLTTVIVAGLDEWRRQL